MLQKAYLRVRIFKEYNYFFENKLLMHRCWGDPHCSTFDKAKFDFMGRCKYQLVSTDCYNKTLVNICECFFFANDWFSSKARKHDSIYC